MNPIEDRLSRPGGLAARLRALREQAGLAGKDLATEAGWAPSKVSRIELGRQMPADADVTTWAGLCRADDTTLAELRALLQDARDARLDWRRQMRHGQASVQQRYSQLVKESSRIVFFETVWIPGMLQTPDYMHRVFTEMVRLHQGSDDIDKAVAERVERQQFLYDRAKRFEFLLWEPVLRTRLCPPEQTRAQLDRLQTVIGMPNVRFGIVPLGRVLDTTPQGSFQLYDDVAIIETFVGEAIYADDDTGKLNAVLRDLWTEAVEGEDARPLVIEASRAA